MSSSDNEAKPIRRRAPVDWKAFKVELAQLLRIPLEALERLNAISNHSIYPSPGTQQAIILYLLALNYGRFVGLDVLMRESHAGAVHSIVCGLRKRGWAVENRRGKTIVRDGIKCQRSEYRLNLDTRTTGPTQQHLTLTGYAKKALD